MLLPPRILCIHKALKQFSDVDTKYKYNLWIGRSKTFIQLNALAFMVLRPGDRPSQVIPCTDDHSLVLS